MDSRIRPPFEDETPLPAATLEAVKPQSSEPEAPLAEIAPPPPVSLPPVSLPPVSLPPVSLPRAQLAYQQPYQQPYQPPQVTSTLVPVPRQGAWVWNGYGYVWVDAGPGYYQPRPRVVWVQPNQYPLAGWRWHHGWR